MHSAIAHKISRIARGRHEKLRVLDLFAGCGGLSLGFESAGFEITAAVELDPNAARSHAENFYGSFGQDVIDLHAASRDITVVEPEEIIGEFALGDPALAVDVIVGGPPCQAYARIGRAKLREIADHPRAYKVEPRANLYLRYLHYIERLKPLAILMENVPDIMNFGGHNVVQEICDALDDIGYDARYSLINSAHYGVPQMRDRVYMIAYRKELNANISFPIATHKHRLPPGYVGQRAVALKLVDLFNGRAYVDSNHAHSELPPAVTANQAIGDLPAITIHLEGRQRRGVQHFKELAKYRKTRPSAYAQSMRNWPGYENKVGIFDHVMRCLPRDTLIFQAMEPGSEYPAALELAVSIFEKEAKRKKLPKDTGAWSDLRRSMVPPYDPGKFPNRWWKLVENHPVRTLTAHIGKDTYTHIHFDSSQGRVISVREAARLQSFPDGFCFCGAMNAAYRQIGNAVPPLMAKHLAKSIRTEILDRSAIVSTPSMVLAAE